MTTVAGPEYEWQPHPGPQEDFCSRGEFLVFFGGAKGPGKSDCLIMEATRGYKIPWYKALILRRTFPRLQEIIDRTWKLYPKLGGTYRAGEHRWYFESGATITLGHCQHEEDKRNWHGKEFYWLGFDELTEFSATQFHFIIANVRRSKPEPQLQVMATSNPGGPGHIWVKEFFVDPCQPTQKEKYLSGDGEIRERWIPKTYIDPITGMSRVFVPATVYDNPSIMVNDPTYVKRLEALPEIEKLRFLHGVWDVFEGQVFSELNQHVHACDPFDVPPEWECFQTFDWGYSRPWAAFWWAVDFDGVLYLYREFYGAKDYEGWIAGKVERPDWNKGLRQTNTEICRKIHEIERGQEKVNYRVADPACWAPTKLRGSNKNFGPSFVEDARNEGLFFLKADNDRMRGIQQVHERFRLEEEIDRRTGEVLESYPRFQAFKNCRRWWDEMQSLYEDPKNPEDIDTDQPDEGYDCTRYACMSRPILPKRRKKEIPGTFQAERKRLVRAKQYARRHGISLAAAYARIR